MENMGKDGNLEFVEYQIEENKSASSFKEGFIRDLLWQPMDYSSNDTTQLSIVNVYVFK